MKKGNILKLLGTLLCLVVVLTFLVSFIAPLDLSGQNEGTSIAGSGLWKSNVAGSGWWTPAKDAVIFGVSSGSGWW